MQHSHCFKGRYCKVMWTCLALVAVLIMAACIFLLVVGRVYGIRSVANPDNPKPKPGDLIFCHGNRIISRIVQWAQANYFSHVFLVVSEDKCIMVINGRRVELVDLNAFLNDPNCYVYTCPILTDEQRKEIVSEALEHIGDKYGYLTAFVQALRYVFHVQIRDDELRPFNCSTLVHYCYLKAGVRLTWAPVPSVADLAHSPLLVGYRPWGTGKEG